MHLFVTHLPRCAVFVLYILLYSRPWNVLCMIQKFLAKFTMCMFITYMLKHFILNLVSLHDLNSHKNTYSPILVSDVVRRASYCPISCCVCPGFPTVKMLNHHSCWTIHPTETIHPTLFVLAWWILWCEELPWCSA